MGWHLQIGKEILDSRQVPETEQINYTLMGVKWVDHEWLSNLSLYIFYDKFGYLILSIIFAAFIVFLFYLLNHFLRLYASVDKMNSIILPLEIYGLVAIGPHTGVRIQEIGLLFFLVFLIILKKAELTKNFLYFFWLIPLLYFWACMHGSFLISLFLLAFWLGIKIFEKFFSNFLKKVFSKYIILAESYSWREIIICSSLSIFAVAATFFTPYGVDLYKFLLDYSSSFYAYHIMEWLPIFSFPTQLMQLVYLCFAISLFLIYFFNLKNYSRKPLFNLWEIGCFFLFFILAFKSRRHFPLFFISSLPAIVIFLKHEFVDTGFKMDSYIYKILKPFICVVFILTCLLLILKTNFTNEPFWNEKFCKSYPCGIVQKLKKNQEFKDSIIFNNYNWGGYLIWNLPGEKLFIDGRMPQYKFNNHTILEEYYDVLNLPQKKLDEYKIDLVLMGKKKPADISLFDKFLFNRKKSDLNKKNNFEIFIENSADWQLIFNDESGYAYIKKTK